MTLLFPRIDKFWEGAAISNGATTRLDDGNILMLYRANGFHTPETARGFSYLTPEVKPVPRAYSRLGLAILDPEGRQVLKRSESPVLSPPSGEMYRYPNGFEDPSVTKMGDKYYITATAINTDEVMESKKIAGMDLNKDIKGHYIYLIETKDFKNFKYHGQVSPDIFDKNGFLHSEQVKIDDKPHFLLFHRLKTDIQVALADSLEKLKDPNFWKQEVANRQDRTLLTGKFPWEGFRPSRANQAVWPGQLAGAAAPVKFHFNPKTNQYIPPEAVENTPAKDKKEGWLFLYNAAGAPANGKVTGRKIGYCVLSIDKDSKSISKDAKSKNGLPVSVIARSPKYLLGPETETEMNGRYGEPVVFSCGYTPTPDGKGLDVFYGGGDRVISKSRFDMAEICNYVLKHGTEKEG